MSEIKVNLTFISEKVSKIRWLPEQYASSVSFVTGSWDFPINSIKLWKLTPNDLSDNENELIPKCTAKISIKGDITGLELIDYNHIAISSSDGML